MIDNVNCMSIIINNSKISQDNFVSQLCTFIRISDIAFVAFCKMHSFTYQNIPIFELIFYKFSAIEIS